MKVTIRIASKQDLHWADEYLWPDNVPLALPGVGDDVATNRFGLRKLIMRSFAYDSLATDSKVVTHLIIDLICVSPDVPRSPERTSPGPRSRAAYTSASVIPPARTPPGRSESRRTPRQTTRAIHPGGTAGFAGPPCR